MLFLTENNIHLGLFSLGKQLLMLGKTVLPARVCSLSSFHYHPPTGYILLLVLNECLPVLLSTASKWHCLLISPLTFQESQDYTDSEEMVHFECLSLF